MSAPVVVKVGTSSITDPAGVISAAAVGKLCDEVAAVRALGRPVLVVTSGAIAAGLPELGLGGSNRPKDPVTLQAVSAIGQSTLIGVYKHELGRHGLVAGQVLLTPLDFMLRTQYLQARATLMRLLELGVVPVINENDAVADDEIRFGDNDRIAALVAHLVDAQMLVLLTDMPGLLTADPRRDTSASLIEEIVQIDRELEALAGGTGSARGSGGMASKLAAAKIATWSGVEAVIAAAHRPNVLLDAVSGVVGTGTVFRARPERLPARKLWIAFAVASKGQVVVDAGARRALTERSVSLLPAGVLRMTGTFETGDAVELVDPAGVVFAKGLVRYGSAALSGSAGRRSNEIDPELPVEVIHRDDLVLLP